MKRKVMLAALVITLMLASFAALAVSAAKDKTPKDDDCARICSKAYVYGEKLDAGGSVVLDKHGKSIWVRVDFDGDGRVEKCSEEYGPEGTCHLAGPPYCPESGDHCMTKAEAEAQTDPAMRFYCGLPNGSDAHPGGH